MPAGAASRAVPCSSRVSLLWPLLCLRFPQRLVQFHQAASLLALDGREPGPIPECPRAPVPLPIAGKTVLPPRMGTLPRTAPSIFANGVEELIAYRATVEAARLDRLEGLGEPRERVPSAHRDRAPLSIDFVSTARRRCARPSGSLTLLPPVSCPRTKLDIRPQSALLLGP